MANKVAPESFDFPESAAPATPDSGYVRLYAKTNNKLYIKDDTGTETELGGGTVAAHASTHAAGGGDEIDGDALEANTSVTNYTPSSSTIGGHLSGINAKLGLLSPPFEETTEIVKGTGGGGGKRAKFSVNGFATNVTRTYTLPDANTILVGTGVAQSLSSKTIDADSNTISNIGAAEVKPDLISGAIEITSVDSANDFLHILDATDGLLKKVKPQHIGGSAYVADGITFTDPTTPTWTARNQGVGTFTEDTTNKVLTVLTDGNGSLQLRGWSTPAPSTPYRVRMYIKHILGTGANNGVAVGFRENATGELATALFYFGSASPASIAFNKWNSETSFNANYTTFTNQINSDCFWFELEDDGTTNRYMRIGSDPYNFIEHSVGRTDFLTPDQIFFGATVQTATALDVRCTLESYEEL